MPDSKFRSIQAFREFEQKGSSKQRPQAGGVGARSASTLSPLRVLALVKQRAGGITRAELVRELDGDAEAVDAAVLKLLAEDLVRLETGNDGERVVAV